jgi:class 3 adenylate cyclase
VSKTIHKYGGDIIQFLGNSLIAVWLSKTSEAGAGKEILRPFSKVEEEKLNEYIEEEIMVSRRAIQCALDIRNEKHKLFEEIHIGLGFGDCGILHVGGVFKRVEYCLIGSALNQALGSLKLASKQ